MPAETTGSLPRAKLDAGARRLRANAALEAASVLLPAVPAAAAVVIILQRLFYLGEPSGWAAAIGLPAWAPAAVAAALLLPVAAALVAYFRSGHGALSAAVTADMRLGLRERISSAFAAGPGAAMNRALLDDARRRLEKVNVSRDFPLRIPRRPVLWSVTLLLAAPLLALLPQADVLGREKRAVDKQTQTQDIVRVQQEMERRLAVELQRKQEEKKPGADTPGQKLQQELSQLVKEMKEAEDREQILTKLNRLNDEVKLAEQRAAGMADMMRKMEQLQKQGDAADLPKGPAAALAAAMAGGDFKRAAEEMKRLADDMEKKLAEGGLSPEEQEKLREDLERLTKLTEDWKELSGKFEKAAGELGTDDGLEAMQEALQGLEELAELLKELGLDGEGASGLDQELQRLQLTQEMVDQLKKMLQNATRCTVCKKLYCLNCGRPVCACEGLEQCDCEPCEPCGTAGIPGLPGSGGQNPGGGPGGGGLPGTGGGGNGAGNGNGAGMGGYGQGEGGIAPENEGDVGFVSTKVRGQLGEGRIISHMFQRGAPIVTEDEKRTEYNEAHSAAAQAATEEISNGRIPRELRGYIRDYFTATGPTAPAETTKPGSTGGGAPAPEGGER